VPTKVPDEFNAGEPNVALWTHLLRWNYDKSVAARPKSLQDRADHSRTMLEVHRKKREDGANEESVLEEF
jgi:hypothetical protein